MSYISEISIPRYTLHKEYKALKLYDFCDASEVIYDACIYIKTINKGASKFIMCKIKSCIKKYFFAKAITVCSTIISTQQVCQALPITLHTYGAIL